MTTKKENLELIASYFLKKSKEGSEFGLFEFGIDFRRFDCMIFNANKLRLRGYEFKVDRQDFLNEIRTEKWKCYLPYCHTFSFVCPKGLVDKSEIPPKVGLLWITTVNKHYGYTDRDYDSPHGIWVKMPHFLGKIPEEEFQRIVLVLISRIKFRKDVFY